MNIFKRLFGKNEPQVQCPRCLGKGHVDHDDIKRLKKELFWIPGSCAYCNGKGTVEQKVIDNVAADYTYLTINLTEKEKRSIKNGDPESLRLGRVYESNIKNFIAQIHYLHVERELSASEIADLFLEKRYFPKEEKPAMIEYIGKVIRTKGN